MKVYGIDVRYSFTILNLGIRWRYIASCPAAIQPVPSGWEAG
jgi:hypothetical protein